MAQTYRGGRTGYGNHLSPREQQVVELVRRRHTTREIARVLSLSEHTVKHHIDRARAKLGVASRRKL